MKKTLYNSLSAIIKNISEIKENKIIIRKKPESIKNLLIGLSLLSFGGLIKKIPPENIIKGGDLFKKCPDDIKADYGFPANLKIYSKDLEKLIELSKISGEFLVAGVYEFFLEESSGETYHSRKKVGSFFTPRWVVNDIIKHSLKPKLEKFINKFKEFKDKNNYSEFVNQWKTLRDFRVLDPAGGWGAFIVQIYRELEKFYKEISAIAESLIESYNEKSSVNLDMFSQNNEISIEDIQLIKDIILTTKNPGRFILSKNLYSFDISKEAVKIASHILKMLVRVESSKETELENKKIVTHIKECDFIKWMENPNQNYDVIVGNPPYFSIGGGGKGRKKTHYHSILKEHPLFSSYFRSQSDIFYYFIIGSLEILKYKGVLSFIVPSYWLDNEYADKLRESLLKESSIEEIINFTPHKIFQTFTQKKVSIDTLILRAIKKPKNYSKPNRVFPIYLAIDEKSKKTLHETPNKLLKAIRNNDKDIVMVNLSSDVLGNGKWILSSKLYGLNFFIKDGIKTYPLGDISPLQKARYPQEFINITGKEVEGICYIGQGQEAGYSRAFIVTKERAALKKMEPYLLKPLIKSSNIKKWAIKPSNKLIIMPQDTDNIEEYPNIKNHLEFYKEILITRQRVITGKRKWYSFSIPQNFKIFESIPKIVVPYRANNTSFAIDTEGHFNDSGDVRGITIKPQWKDKVIYEYLLSLLNSQLIYLWYEKAGKKKGAIFEFFTRPLSRIPVRIPPMEIQEEIKTITNKIINLTKTNLNSEKSVSIEDDVAKLEKELNNKIYDIYEITEEELREKILN